jgi:predicted MFS family arabinose efflux permease
MQVAANPASAISGGALHPLQASQERWVLFTLACMQFTEILDFMVLTLIGPQLVKDFAITDAQYALLITAYSFAAGIAGLLSATYIERFDRKRVLLVVYTLFGLATLSSAFAPDYGSFMASRIFAGLCGGALLAMLQTIIGDVVPFERRGRAIGILMASNPAATVIGVPIALLLVSRFGWSAPYFLLCGFAIVLALVAWRLLPSLTGHIALGAPSSAMASVKQVLADPNHRLTYVFSGLLMFTGFTIIPFVTIFATSNLGLSMEQVPLLFLCGGIVALLATPPLYWLTDKKGKVLAFRVMTLAVLLPMFVFTLLPPSPLPLVLIVSTLFFVCMGGRLIPGLAIVNSAADPRVRGTFMSLNICIQSAAIGLASLVAGLVVQRDAQGALQYYWLSASFGALACVLTLMLVGRLHLHGATETTRS